MKACDGITDQSAPNCNSDCCQHQNGHDAQEFKCTRALSKPEHYYSTDRDSYQQYH